MAYNNPRHAIQLSQAQRAQVIEHILATVPAEGRVLTGTISGVFCATSKNQREAIEREKARLLRKLRREAAKAVAA